MHAMSANWSPEERLNLVETLVARTSGDLEQFFAAHGLGASYAGLKHGTGKKVRVNAALADAERRGDVSLVLTAAAEWFGFDRSMPALIGSQEVNMPSDGKIFISHASGDAALAALLKETLVLGGVPGDRIFFSSDRSSGIPAGKGVVSYLQKMLSESSFAVEILTETFLERPFCLIELGGAWAMDKPTFPIIVPPLSRQEVARRIGDFQSAILGEAADVEKLFDELNDFCREHAGLINLRTTDWNDAVRKFKTRFPLTLIPESAESRVDGGSPGSSDESPSTTSHGSDTEVLARGIRLSNFSIIDTRFSTELHGEVENRSDRRKTLIVKATFFSPERRIVGVANGVVSELEPGEVKTFTLNSTEPIVGFAYYRVQIETEL
jgi:hypothetical protein